MSTLKRRLASQANGKLSRGPVTPAGKRNSAANAVHHGMLANSYVLNGEARERFERILDRLDTEFEPETESEQALVDMIAVARWRQMRIWGYERATIAKEIAHRNPNLAATPQAKALKPSRTWLTTPAPLTSSTATSPSLTACLCVPSASSRPSEQPQLPPRKEK